MPPHLRPEVVYSRFGDQQQLVQLPVGDLLIRKENVARVPENSTGMVGFWPHLKGHVTYCSFRNPRLNPSVHGGDAVCSVETVGGRRKVSPRDLLDCQRTMRANIVAAPGEEVAMDVVAPRRAHRAVSRAKDWLKDILDAKAQEPALDFDWYVLASIQGGGNIKERQKACQLSAATEGVSGFWLGGLGYSESISARGRVIEAITSVLPEALPRFLPLGDGSPIEVLQAVLLGVDVLEVCYPVQAAAQGCALIFSCEMPIDWESDATADAEALRSLIPAPSPPAAVDAVTEVAAPTEVVAADAPPDAGAPELPKAVRQLHLRAPECREDFGPIDETSVVRQYSRAYFYHLLEVRELLGTQLLVRHNLQVYENFFASVREHIRKGTLRRFAAWFLRTQTCEPVAPTPSGPAQKKRKR